MHLTAEQLEAVQSGKPLRFTAPETGGEYVLLRADVYERVKALLADDDLNPEALYPLLAEISPEDWEDGAAYGISLQRT